jgi:hypothetical protein
VFTRPTDLDDANLRGYLAENWAIEDVLLEYRPVGFGSHHWLATVGLQPRWFVTVDDLRSWSGSSSGRLEEAFERLARAFRCAQILEGAGLDFVVGPQPTTNDRPSARLGPHYSVVVHRYLAGHTAGENGEYTDPLERLKMVSHLVALHDASPLVEDVAVVDDLEVPLREDLERLVLTDLGTPWDGGPYGEPTRALLLEHSAGIARLLARHDQWAETVAERSSKVITHGEPHAANVLVAEEGLRLVDWESALLAPPERDLWVLDPGDGSVLDAYRRLSGRKLDPVALDCYRLWYDLFEIAGYVSGFRAHHEDTADSQESWKNLVHFCQPEARWPRIFRS